MTSPIALEVLEIDPKGLERDIHKLTNQIEQVDNDNLGWLYKQRELVQLRVGDRQRVGRGPWRHSANVSVPLIDGIIRRYKPGLSSLILDADPVARFTAQTPDDIDAARVTEQFMTWYFLDHMDTTYEVNQLIDMILWRGHAYVREGWDYRTEREARVLRVETLFPEGVEQTVRAVQEAEVQAGAPDVSDPVDIVVDILANEYDLDPDDDEPGGDGEESEILTEAAQKILAGAEYIKLVYRKVLCDKASWKVIDPTNVITPMNQDPEDAEFVCIIHEIDEDTLRAKARDGLLPKKRVEEILARGQKQAFPETGRTSASARRDIRDVMDRRAGNTSHVSDDDSGNYVLWEIYAKLDIDEDGERERCIIWYAPEQNMTVAVLDYPFPFENWPVTYFGFEGTKRPVDNRGLADMLKTPQRLANAYHNARIDAAQLALAPTFQYRAADGQGRQKLDFRPGGMIPVQQIGDIAPIQNDLRILQGLQIEEQTQQRIAEQYAGVFDATLQNFAQGKERRTAAEINAIQSVSGSVFGLDAKLFQYKFSRSFSKIHQLIVDFGDPEMYYRVQNEPQPRLAKKHEIGRMYDIKAAGTPANTSKSLQLNILQSAMQLVLTQPMVMQSGRVDIFKLIQRYLQNLDYDLAKDIIRPEEEATLIQQARAGVDAVGQDPAIF